MGELTVSTAACGEFYEKKSRFIGHIAPATTEEMAVGFLAQIKGEHPSATHHCYAWVIGENDRLQRSSDAGEPAGTAGRPILEAIKRRGLHHTIIVVTRYFGGILLGAGGLTRAYSKATLLAIESAQLVEKIPAKRIALCFDYTLLGKVDTFLQQQGIQIENKIFDSKVAYFCLVEESAFPSLPTALSDMSAGQLQMQILEEHTFLAKNIPFLE